VVALHELLDGQHVWRGRPTERPPSREATGHGELDEALPGRGWPERSLMEILIPADGVGEIELQLLTLVRLTGAGRLVCNDPVKTCSAVTLTKETPMSAVMEEEIKRWTARRKSQLVLEIIQGRTTVSEASRQFDLPPSEIESWVDEGKRGLENALRAKPEDVREQYERQLRELQEAYGEAMLELRARKKLASLLGKDET
jgi:transposase-like protein